MGGQRWDALTVALGAMVSFCACYRTEATPVWGDRYVDSMARVLQRIGCALAFLLLLFRAGFSAAMFCSVCSIERQSARIVSSRFLVFLWALVMCVEP